MYDFNAYLLFDDILYLYNLLAWTLVTLVTLVIPTYPSICCVCIYTIISLLLFTIICKHILSWSIKVIKYCSLFFSSYSLLSLCSLQLDRHHATYPSTLFILLLLLCNHLKTFFFFFFFSVFSCNGVWLIWFQFQFLIFIFSFRFSNKRHLMSKGENSIFSNFKFQLIFFWFLKLNFFFFFLNF